MQMKNYMAVMISLAVSVILVVGVLVPVIADNSGNGGGETITNESNTNDYYIRADENTHITLYKNTGRYDDTHGYTNWYSYEDLTVNPDAEKWVMNDAYQSIMGKYYYEQSDTLYDFVEGHDFKYIKWPIVINGTTATVTDTNDNTATFEDVCLITAPQRIGNYVAITNDDTVPAVIPYVKDSWVGIAIDDWTVSGEPVILGFGQTDTGTFEFGNYWNWETPSELANGTFNVDDGYLTSITIPYDDVDMTYSITDSEDDYELYYFVPTQIGDGSSGGMSPTLSAMLSVIPLIVVVGLIIGTVGYFIRRQ